MAQILTRQQIYDIAVTELKAQNSKITDFNEGSLADVMSGVIAQVLSEMSELTVTEFSKTFFNSANGPEVTGSTDDLQTLAVDHFGDDFARPSATESGGQVTFSRSATTAGDVLIQAGTAVSTSANASGQKTRFVTLADVTMTGTSINAQVQCDTAGAAGDVAAGSITTIQTTLTDPTVTVTNAAAMSGGEDELNDAQYRAFILNKLKGLKGATLAALKAIAATVAGVQTVTAIEQFFTAIQYNIGTGLPVPGAVYFQFPYAYIYIADVNGSASNTLVKSVQTAIDEVRAAGVKVQVVGAQPVSQNWTMALTLNAGGPNFATLQSDKTQLLQSMANYVAALDIGTGFNRTAAVNAFLAIWGPSGTNDVVAATVSTPIGDVSITATQKLIPGTMAIA